MRQGKDEIKNKYKNINLSYVVLKRNIGENTENLSPWLSVITVIYVKKIDFKAKRITRVEKVCDNKSFNTLWIYKWTMLVMKN